MDRADRRSRNMAVTSAVGRAVVGTLDPERAFQAIAESVVLDGLKLDGLALVPLDSPPAFNEHVASEGDRPSLRAALAAQLLLVPRHPQRFDEVAALLAMHGIAYVRRSENRAPPADCRVLLGDSMGEMAAYYAACDLAFIGGSLLPCGGQNLIEASAGDRRLPTFLSGSRVAQTFPSPRRQPHRARFLSTTGLGLEEAERVVVGP